MLISIEDKDQAAVARALTVLRVAFSIVDEPLHTFIDQAVGEGCVFNGIDAADLYQTLVNAKGK